jgi:hypothetical protein
VTITRDTPTASAITHRMLFVLASVLATCALGCGNGSTGSGTGSSTAATRTFQCYRTPHDHVERECSVTPLLSCETSGCFTQDRAFCFWSRFQDSSGTDERSWVCAASEPECQSWHRTAIEFARTRNVPSVHIEAGPCISMRPEEVKP